MKPSYVHEPNLRMQVWSSYGKLRMLMEQVLKKIDIGIQRTTPALETTARASRCSFRRMSALQGGGGGVDTVYYAFDISGFGFFAKTCGTAYSSFLVIVYYISILTSYRVRHQESRCSGWGSGHGPSRHILLGPT